jgi:hypothetical protein
MEGLDADHVPVVSLLCSERTLQLDPDADRWVSFYTCTALHPAPHNQYATPRTLLPQLQPQLSEADLNGGVRFSSLSSSQPSLATALVGG